MDLLGSIMSKMEKPPTTTTQAQRDAKKKQMDEAKRLKEKEKERLLAFRKSVEATVAKFVQDETVLKKSLSPMDELQRSVVHDVAEVAGLVCHAFGEEGVDRHIMLFKKEYSLSAEELAALRRGEEYDPVLAKEQAFQRDLQRHLAEQDDRRARARKGAAPPAAYQQKRQHMLGADEGPARPSAVNAQFGVVASHLKTDKRSIEETLADIRAKKRRQDGDPGTGADADS